jgi:predicted nuclease of predicted toxin-antitoxin system
MIKQLIVGATILALGIIGLTSFQSEANAADIKSTNVEACDVFGEIKIVTYDEDFSVKKVGYGEDLKVKWVTYGSDDEGLWEKVTYGEDFKIKWVTYGEDFTIKEVTYSEGC